MQTFSIRLQFQVFNVPDNNSGKVKHELRVTSSNTRVRRLKARVGRLKAQVARLKARVGRLKA